MTEWTGYSGNGGEPVRCEATLERMWFGIEPGVCVNVSTFVNVRLCEGLWTPSNFTDVKDLFHPKGTLS